MTKLKMRIEGMSCGACVDKVFNALSSLDGVSKVKVDLDKGASVVYDPETVTEADILSTISDAGFKATVKHGLF